jgi:hypothetical protein
MQMGIFTVEEVASVLDMPDIKAIRGDASAFRENIEKRLKDLISGKAGPAAAAPSPYMDLQMASNMTRQRINRMEADGEDDQRIQPLREFFAMTQTQLAASQPPAPPSVEGTAPVAELAEAAQQPQEAPPLA